MSDLDVGLIRAEVQNRANFRCKVCDSMVPEGFGEVAHKIARTDGAVRKYGAGVIEHPMNKEWTCRGDHNDAVNIGKKPVAVAELVEKIRLQILEDAGVKMMRWPHLYTELFTKLMKITWGA